MPRFKSLTYPEFFPDIYRKLPPTVGIFYSEIKRTFHLEHEVALQHTYRFAYNQGLTKGQPGLPGYESVLEFLLKPEV